MNYHSEKLIPKYEDGCHVLSIGRVSTLGQDINNIEAGHTDGERSLKDITDAPQIIRRLGEQSSGMIVDRPTMNEAYDLIESDWVDVVVMEDLSKSFRNPRWIMAFVQDCVDLGVRVIAPGDNLDTWEDNWEVTLGAAVLRHGLHIPDTRRRVRRTATQSFHKGGMVLRVRFGYEKLTADEAKAKNGHPDELLMAKLPQHTQTIHEIRKMIVKNRLHGAAIARWLNEQKVPTGLYVKSGKWTAPIVINLCRDSILAGHRKFRDMIYQPIFKTGKHRRDKNANPEREHYEELAHMSQEQWDELQQALEEMKPRDNQKSGRDHSRFGVRRCDTVVPYQHARCAICGKLMDVSGEGVMKCKQARSHAGDCWNHVQINIDRTRVALIDLLLTRIAQTDGAWQAMLDAAWTEFEASQLRSNQSLSDIDRKIKTLKTEADRIVKAIRAGVALESITLESESIQKELKQAEVTRKSMIKKSSLQTPAMTREQFGIDPKTTLIKLAQTSFGFAELLRRIIPRFEIHPIQQIDSGQVRPRAILTIDPGLLLTNGQVQTSSPQTYELDLFNSPLHIALLPEVVKIKAENPKWGYVRIARAMGDEKMRMTVKRAFRYKRLMDEEGLKEPYRILTEKPEHASRWKPRKKE
jgi:site-specific DNA recombinase